MNLSWMNSDQYRELKLPFSLGQRRTLYSAGHSPETLFLELRGHIHKPEIIGSVVFGKCSEGPPRHTHGGMVAYVLDEAMGCAAWHAGKQVVAETIEVKFRRFVPLFTELHVHANVTKTVGRNVYVTARIENAGQTIWSESRGRFRILSEASISRLLEEP